MSASENNSGQQAGIAEGSSFLQVPQVQVYAQQAEDGNGLEMMAEEGELREEEQREQWGSNLQFFFTVLGFCVGLGNIWRFPYLCQENGGGAFVIPFLVMMVLEGMPLLLLELGIGQKFRKGSYIVWNQIHPWLGGIGLGSTVIAIVVGCYYNVIIAWCIFYLFNSFRLTLPWGECPLADPISMAAMVTDAATSNATFNTECTLSSETQFFWYRTALDISPDVETFDGVRWWMLLCLVIAWAIVYLITMRGIQSSGYVVYFTALFPYFVLTIFFIRGITLKGAGAGLMHMFYPKMDKLLQPTVWLDAANQVFYSYGLAFGSIIGFGSYNPVDKNCVKDVFIITGCNVFTAIYACAVIFSILGFKAQHLFEKCMAHDVEILIQTVSEFANKTVEDISENQYLGIMASGLLDPKIVSAYNIKNCTIEAELDQAAQGTGLAFIVMADVFTKLPGSPFWSVLFFAMLLSLGLGSQIGILEGVMGTLFDMPQLKHLGKPILSAIACGIGLLIGIVFTTGAGEYWLSLFDKYGAMGLTLIAFVELMAVMYVYGHEQFTEDIYSMTGVKPGIYWQATWRFIAPSLMAGLVIVSIILELLSSPSYSAWNKELGISEQKAYPAWCMYFAVFLSVLSLIPIIVIAVLRALKIKVLETNVYSTQMRRIDTTASTRPMMRNDTNSDFPIDQDDDRRSQGSSDSDRGIVADDSRMPKRF